MYHGGIIEIRRFCIYGICLIVIRLNYCSNMIITVEGELSPVPIGKYAECHSLIVLITCTCTTHNDCTRELI